MTTLSSTNSRTVWSSLTERLFNVVNQSLQARYSLKTAAICHRVHNEKPITPFNGTLQRGRRRTYTFLKTNRSVRIEVMNIWIFKDAIFKAILEHKGCKLNPQTLYLLLLKCFNVLTKKHVLFSTEERKPYRFGMAWPWQNFHFWVSYPFNTPALYHQCITGSKTYTGCIKVIQSIRTATLLHSHRW